MQGKRQDPIVDDDESVRQLLRRTVSSAGSPVWKAADGRQAAIQIAGHAGVDLVLTDLVMPEQEGIELICNLRSGRPLLKVIAMSGAFGGEILPVAKRLGAAVTLQKPISRENLLRTIQEVLNS